MKITEQQITHVISLEWNGAITPEIVLADARQATSPLHSLYDWDVEKAAHQHWLDRSREIIRLVSVVETTTEAVIKLPRYWRDPTAPAQEQGYTTIGTLRLDPTLARRALITEFERITSAFRRAQKLAIGLDCEDAISELLERVAGLRLILSETKEQEAQPQLAAN